MFMGAPAAPAPMQTGEAPLQSPTIPPMAGAPWLNQTTPYPSAFMAPPAWPIYMPNYLPRPQAQQSSTQAKCEELARQCPDLEARALKLNRELELVT